MREFRFAKKVGKSKDEKEWRVEEQRIKKGLQKTNLTSDNGESPSAACLLEQSSKGLGKSEAIEKGLTDRRTNGCTYPQKKKRKKRCFTMALWSKIEKNTE